MSCALLVAHFCLQSGKHSCRDFCSEPLGLVHSYMHLLKQASKAGSFLVPLRAGSSLAAQADEGTAQVAMAVVAAAEKNWARDRGSAAKVVLSERGVEEEEDVNPSAEAKRRAAVKAEKVFIVVCVSELLEEDF